MDFGETYIKVFSYRSVSSVYKHVRRKFHIFDVRAKWTKSDDEQLKQLTLTYQVNGHRLVNLWEECLKIVVIVIEIIWLLVRIGKK